MISFDFYYILVDFIIPRKF